MRSGKKSIITPINPVIIPNYKSYWATHFYSILKCIDNHKNLMYSPIKFKEYPLWSLSLLRGNLNINFFEALKSYIQNWGLQYFFASLFNQKIGSHIIIELIERLEGLYGVCFNQNLDQFSFYVSGNDSQLRYKLEERFVDIFPYKEMKGETSSLLGCSDLCLILDNTFTGDSVAIFGEVEGSTKSVFFEESNYSGIPRVNLFFEKKHFFINDFLHYTYTFFILIQIMKGSYWDANNLFEKYR